MATFDDDDDGGEMGRVLRARIADRERKRRERADARAAARSGIPRPPKPPRSRMSVEEQKKRDRARKSRTRALRDCLRGHDNALKVAALRSLFSAVQQQEDAYARFLGEHARKRAARRAALDEDGED